jgi:hypothetical protein
VPEVYWGHTVSYYLLLSGCVRETESLGTTAVCRQATLASFHRRSAGERLWKYREKRNIVAGNEPVPLKCVHIKTTLTALGKNKASR